MTTIITIPTPDNPFPVTGVPGGPHLRRDITEFSTDQSLSKQWNLYVKALAVFQSRGIHDPLSFYQVAGIHGLPYVHWLENFVIGDRPGEYCTHGTSLFLTWHRPYLLLFEQCIVNAALEVVETLPANVREEYRLEAYKIRIPYWDWATNSDVPAPLRSQSITISLPTGHSGTIVDAVIPNPLYSYKFDDFQRQRDFNILYYDIALSKFPETKRCPDKDGNSHPERVDEQLKGPRKRNPDGTPRPSFRDAMYKLLMMVDDYGSFSNTSAPPHVSPVLPNPRWQSLESYHNEIHNYIGSDFGPDPNVTFPGMIIGHMTEVPVSAFDPIFWLHHANIDRMYALWQCIHYKSEFKGQPPEINRIPEPPRSGSGSAAVDLDTVDTTLRPFRFSKDRTWTSRDVHYAGQGDDTYKSVFDYNYHYPEIDFKATSPSEQLTLSRAVQEKVVTLYGPKRDEVGLSDGPIHAPKVGRGLQARYRWEWMVFLRVKKYLIAGNFAIFFFLGKPEPDPFKWATSPNLAGSFQTFKSKTDYCANCSSQEAAEAMMSGGVHLTEALYDKLQEEGSGIDPGDREGVKNWLVENLDWRILEIGGRELDLDVHAKPENLEVNVGSFEMAYITGHAFFTAPGGDDEEDDAFEKFGKVYGAETHFSGTTPMDIRLL